MVARIAGPLGQQSINYIQPPAPQPQQQGNPLSAFGGQLAGKAINQGTSALGAKAGEKLAGTAVGAALTPVLGPLGPIIGQGLGSAVASLFAGGGKVEGKKSWLASLFGPGKPRTSRVFGEATKAPRTRTTAQRKAGGGMIMMPLADPKNPNGYAEGGAVQETPIKKVMDEQKLMQQAMAFNMDEMRKQETHSLAMKQKQQQFSAAQKMKQASSTTSMKPKKPLEKKNA